MDQGQTYEALREAAVRHIAYCAESKHHLFATHSLFNAGQSVASKVPSRACRLSGQES